MPAQQQHWIRSAYLSGTTGTVTVGTALVSNGTRYVVATAANRASYGRAEGIAIGGGDDDDTQIEIQCAGTIPNSITGLGAGSATWVIVDADGGLERDSSPDSGDDVIGKCNARGDLFVAPGVWDETNTLGGGGGGGGVGSASDNEFLYANGTDVDGTSGLTYNEATNRPIAVNGVEFTNGGNTLILDGAPTGSRTLTLPDATDTLVGKATTDTFTNKSMDLADNTFACTSAELAAACSDETGSGALVFADTPTLVTPNIGAATGTSLALNDGGFVTLGTTAAATAGGIRLRNELAFGSIRARNFGNTANVELIWVDTGDAVHVGDSTNATSTYVRAATSVVLLGGGKTLTQTATSTDFTTPPRIRDSDANQWYTFAVSNLSADRTVTLPLLTGNDVFVFEAHTQTLTNKTLTSPTISAAAISGTWTGAATFSSLQTFTASTAYGATPATTGAIRFTNANTLQWRNNGNSANLIGLYINSGDNVVLGDTTNSGSTYVMSGTGASNVYQSDTHSFITTAAATIATLTSSTATLKPTAFVADGNARAKAYSNIANVQTTDATVTSLYTWTIVDEARTLVTAEVSVCISTGASGAVYVRRTSFKRDGGTVSAGVVEDTYTAEDTAGLDVTIDNSTSTGRVRVTGVAATTYDWGGITSRLEVTHA